MDIKSIVRDYNGLIYKYNKKHRKKLNTIDIVFLSVISVVCVLLQFFAVKENVIATFISCFSLIIILLCMAIYYNHYDSKQSELIAKSIKDRDKAHLEIVIEVLKNHHLDISNDEHMVIILKCFEAYTSNLRNPFSLVWDCIKTIFLPVVITFLPMLLSAETYNYYIVSEFLFALFMLVSLIAISFSPTIYRVINNKKFIAVDIMDLLHGYILEK